MTYYEPTSLVPTCIYGPSASGLCATRPWPAIEPPEAALPSLAARGPVLDLSGRVAVLQLGAPRVAHDPEQHHHEQSAGDAQAQYAHHCQVAPAELVLAALCVFRPARVQRIRRHDTAQVAQPRHERRGGGNSHLAVPVLKDLRGPCHAYRHRGAQAKPHHEQAAVARPSVGDGKRRHHESDNLDAGSPGEEEAPVAVEAIRQGGYEENGNQVHLSASQVSAVSGAAKAPRGGASHDPDGREQEGDLNRGRLRLDGRDDDGSIQLGADADADDAKVHQAQRPQAPVHDKTQVLEGPWAGVVDSTEVVVVRHGIPARERLGRRGQPAQPPSRLPLLARRQRAIGEPPEEGQAQHDGDEAVDEEHPLKSHQAPGTIHQLEAGRDEAGGGGRHLGGGVVHADALSRSRGGVKEGQIEGHAGPHAGEDEAQQEAQQLERPGVADGGEACADEAGREDDPSHPGPGAQLAHGEVGGEVKDDV